LALGASLLAGIEQALPAPSQAHQQELRVDETYIKVKGQDKYLYRAVDSTGQTVDFLLTAKRDTAAAKRFFEKISSSSSNLIPRVINVDKNPAYPAAVEALKAEGTLPRRVRLRQCKYLNNVIEQDHRTRQKADLVSKGVRLLSKCLANSRRHRNDEHDPQGAESDG
jgi:transposase-like protein